MQAMDRLKKFFLPLFTVVTLLFSMSAWFIGLLATPPDRIFAGVNRWSADYYIYLSFVETGARGHFKEYHLTTTKPQEPIWIHGIYTISGYLGRLAGLEVSLVYHLDRLILGGIFISLLYFFYLAVFKSRFWAGITLFFIFWIPGFPQTLDVWGRWDMRYLYEVQESNIVGRATTPPHYLLGFILFVAAVWWFMKIHELRPIGRHIAKVAILVILLNLMTVANPIDLLIFLATVGVYVGIRLIWEILKFKVQSQNLPNSKSVSFKSNRQRNLKVEERLRKVLKRTKYLSFSFLQRVSFLWIYLAAILGTIPVTLYYRSKLSIFPWGPRSNALQYYVPGYPIDIKELILALGPTLVLALVGIGSWVVKVQSSKFKIQSLKDRWLVLFFSWLLAQFGLLFWARNPSHGIDPLRFLQGLYYLPLAGFAVVGLQGICKALANITPIRRIGQIGRIGRIKSDKKWAVIIVGFSFIITLPTLILSYREQLFMNTDYKTFTTLIYPTKYQYKAYKFMEKNTPFASGVLAFYEVTEVLPAFSGNTTERDLSYGEKLPFFSNQLGIEEARQFLQDNYFDYVWVGYQEASAGFRAEEYKFLKLIYQNPEVRVYKVE